MTLQYYTNPAVATVQRHTFHQINVLFTTNLMFIIDIIANRCYVDDSNTCRDARPSSYGAPYRFFFRTKISDCQKNFRPKIISILIIFPLRSWSCQACRSKAKEEKGESDIFSAKPTFEGLAYF